MIICVNSVVHILLIVFVVLCVCMLVVVFLGFGGTLGCLDVVFGLSFGWLLLFSVLVFCCLLIVAMVRFGLRLMLYDAGLFAGVGCCVLCICILLVLCATRF